MCRMIAREAVNGDRTEIPVFSHAQKGRVSVEGDVMTVEYDRLVSGYGDEYEIGFTLRIEKGLKIRAAAGYKYGDPRCAQHRQTLSSPAAISPST